MGEGGERRWKWERSRRARRENRRRTLHCCQVTGGGEADEQDDGRQRGEAPHNSDSDHPVRTCSTGYTTHGDSTEYWLLQVSPGYHQNSSAGSRDHLYGLRSASSNNRPDKFLWSRPQPLLPLHRRHHLHHHPHLDLLLPAPSEGHNKGETALHLHVDGGDLHPAGDGVLHRCLDRPPVRVRVVHQQPCYTQQHLRRQGGSGGIWHFQLDCLWLGHLPHLPGVQQHPTGAPVTLRTIQMMRDSVLITCVPHVDVASQVITYN